MSWVVAPGKTKDPSRNARGLRAGNGGSGGPSPRETIAGYRKIGCKPMSSVRRLVPTRLPIIISPDVTRSSVPYQLTQGQLTQEMWLRKAPASAAAACAWVVPVSVTATAMLPRYPTNQLR